MNATAVLPRIAALVKRDTILELSYTFQLVLRFATVAISVAMFFFLGRLFGDSDQLSEFSGGYFEFALLGLIVMGYSQACVNSFAQSIQRAQTSGTLEILLSTATSLRTLLAGTLVVPLVLASVDASFYLAIGWFFGELTFAPGRLLLVSVLLVLTLGTFAAIGVFSAAVIVLTKRGDPFSSLALQVSNLLAGAVFPITVLPEAMQVLSRFVPAFYGLRGARTVLLADGSFADVSTDLVALTVFNIVLMPVATWLLARALRTARVTGTLGNR